MNARTIAYQAVLASQREEHYASEILEQWAPKVKKRDLAFARELAYGSIRMRLSLDHYASLLAPEGLKLKRKERCLLHIALYQYFYMGSVPFYALCHESVQMANTLCHPRFAKFLNVLLKRLPTISKTLPEDNWSIYYSYPPFLVEELRRDWGAEETKRILQAMNRPATPVARERRLGVSPPFSLHALNTPEDLEKAINSPNFYIQSTAQATLIGKLCLMTSPPKNVLDLCAAPGGKTIAVHDVFPKADFYVNDVKESKMERLRENFLHYTIHAHMRCGKGEDYPLDQQFSIVIVDVPCSNSGVLNKRPEARWRIDENSLQLLAHTQKALISRAAKLLAPEGQLWLMTCSILKKENEALVDFASSELKLQYKETLLPNSSGQDGAFAALFSRKKNP